MSFDVCNYTHLFLSLCFVREAVSFGVHDFSCDLLARNVKSD